MGEPDVARQGNHEAADFPWCRAFARELHPRIAGRRQRAIPFLSDRVYVRHDPDLSRPLEMLTAQPRLSVRDVLLPALPGVPRLDDFLPAVARRLAPRSIVSHVADAGVLTSCSDRRPDSHIRS